MFVLFDVHYPRNDVEKSSGESSPKRRENIRDSAMNTMSGFKGFLVTIAERERAWCSVHKMVGHDNTDCYAQQKNGKSKWCFGHDDTECYVQKKNEATTDDKGHIQGRVLS